MSSLKLEVGKCYVRRDGKVTQALMRSNQPSWPFVDPATNVTYREDGSCAVHADRLDPEDIIVAVAPYHTGMGCEDALDKAMQASIRLTATSAEPDAESDGPLTKFDQEIQSITQRRGDVYGHPAGDFATAADLMKHFDHIEPPQLRHALRLICVKLARIKTTPTHLDSYVDIVGYSRTAVMVIDKLGLGAK